MIGVVGGVSSPHPGTVVTLGPVPGGLVIRGLRLAITATAASAYQFAAAIVGSADRSIGNLNSGQSIIEQGIDLGSPVAIPGLVCTLPLGGVWEFLLPIYAVVAQGSAYVAVLVNHGTATGRFWVGLEVESEREVQLFRARGQRAAWRDGGSVMETLRASAEAARANG